VRRLQSEWLATLTPTERSLLAKFEHFAAHAEPKQHSFEVPGSEGDEEAKEWALRLDRAKDDRSRNDVTLALELWGTTTATAKTEVSLPSVIANAFSASQSGSKNQAKGVDSRTVDVLTNALLIKKQCAAPGCTRVQLGDGILFDNEMVRALPNLRREDCVTGMKMCSGCGRRFYCSRECQASHWIWGHKDECKELKGTGGKKKGKSKVKKNTKTDKQ
jgi:hypothetical protein